MHLSEFCTILGIESSCDDTSIAIYKDATIRSNVVSSQLDHKNLGGVVPELASRKHLENIALVYSAAMREADVTPEELDAIAVTVGPGLMGSLHVGLSFAKGLAMSLGLPLIGVDHMMAHIAALLIEDPKPSFPFICLTVSGGHTQLVIVRDLSDMEVVGRTLDDAAGEAFDKAGKMLGLSYPAGPVVDKLAKEGSLIYPFPIPSVPGYDFSFSGLKTSLLRFLQSNILEDPDFIQKELSNICASFQHTIVTYLLQRLEQLTEDSGITSVAVAGGVSANSYLKQKLGELGREKGWDVYIPPLRYCTDNAAMIAQAGVEKWKNQQFSSLAIEPMPRLSLGSL